jgi:prepilin-type N-terminal cleavage/methylation domain-containing protein
MMKQKIDILKGNKQGFTLVEILVVLAIVGAISGVMAMTISMVRTTTSDTTARNMTMSQVNQAANWIARDIESASSVSFPGGSVLCRVTRYLWDDVAKNFTTETIDYDVTDKVLLRKVNGSANGTPVAQFISYPDTYTSVTRLTSASETNTYVIKLRSVYSNGEEYQQQYKVGQRAPQ